MFPLRALEAFGYVWVPQPLGSLKNIKKNKFRATWKRLLLEKTRSKPTRSNFHSRKHEQTPLEATFAREKLRTNNQNKPDRVDKARDH